MKNKGLILLAGVVVALSLYAYFGEYKREVHEHHKKEVENKIITLKKDQVQNIEIQKGAGALISLKRTIDGWDMEKPAQDQADNEVVESFLDQITSEQATDRIKPQSTDLKEYGLKPSLGTVTLVDNTGKKQEIEISSKKNFEGLVYLKVDHHPEVLTGSQTWTTFLTKPIDQFRNLRLFRGSISKVNKITLDNDKGTTEFEYADGFWFSPQKSNWKLDQNAVREILTQASTAKGTSIIADTRPYGPVGKHLLTLTFQMDKETWKALLHQDSKSKDVIAAISPTHLIIRFPPQTLEELQSKNVLDFRNKTEPFQFDSSNVKRIVAHSKIKSFSLVMTNGHWEQETPDPNAIVSLNMADDLVKKLNRMTVYHYLEHPPHQMEMNNDIQLFNADHELIFQFSWSDFKDHEAYAKTNRSGEVFQIDDAQVNQLMLPEIVKLKPPKISTDKSQKEEKK